MYFILIALIVIHVDYDDGNIFYSKVAVLYYTHRIAVTYRFLFFFVLRVP